MQFPRSTSRTPSDLEATLRETTRFRRLVWLPSCNSTQDLAAAMPRGEGDVVVWADAQRAGRGRKGRAWSSAAGDDLECTARCVDLRVRSPLHLAATVPVAVAEALESEAARQGRPLGAPVLVKWPNDLLIDRGGDRPRKLCGVLIDVTSAGAGPEGHGTVTVCIGIGIGTNRRTFPDELADVATSLSLATDAVFDRGDLLLAVLRHLDRALSLLPSPDGREALGRRFADRVLGPQGRLAHLLCRGDAAARTVEVARMDLDGLEPVGGPRTGWASVEEFRVLPPGRDT